MTAISVIKSIHRICSLENEDIRLTVKSLLGGFIYRSEPVSVLTRKQSPRRTSIKGELWRDWAESLNKEIKEKVRLFQEEINTLEKEKNDFMELLVEKNNENSSLKETIQNFEKDYSEAVNKEIESQKQKVL